MNSTSLARNFIRQLIEYGVSDFVLSPGSRNAPLAIALYEAEQAGFANLHIRIDERGAAFFALGLSKASDNYVAVICTSGTAAANFHPAILEAYHSQNRLLAITADRPAHLRRTGANQTTLQVGLLEPIPTLDISTTLDISHLLHQGPVHLNIQFDEPLLSDERTDWLAGFSPRINTAIPSAAQGSFQARTRGLLIVGHDRAGIDKEAIKLFAQKLGWPLIAEDPLSFPTCIAHAALALSDPHVRAQFAPEQIVVIGRVTLSRSISTLIKECSDLIVIDPRASTIDTDRVASVIFSSLPAIESSPDERWLQSWLHMSAIASSSIELEWSEQAAIRAITSNLPIGAAIFVGSSRPVRDIEAFATPRSGLTTFANRGLAGIDGNMSCAFGIAEKFERSYAILGDITFLHDISALANPSGANLTIFIIDNNGGGIFNTLPQAEVAGFEKLFGTPHNLDLEKIIRSFGVSVTKVKNAADIEFGIAHEPTGLNFVVIEVPDRATNALELKRVTQSLVSALRIGSNLA